MSKNKEEISYLYFGSRIEAEIALEELCEDTDIYVGLNELKNGEFRIDVTRKSK